MLKKPIGPPFTFFGTMRLFDKPLFLLGKVGERPEGPLFVFLRCYATFLIFLSNRVALLRSLAETAFCEYRGLLRPFGTMKNWNQKFSDSIFGVLRFSAKDICFPSLKGDVFGYFFWSCERDESFLNTCEYGFLALCDFGRKNFFDM